MKFYGVCVRINLDVILFRYKEKKNRTAKYIMNGPLNLSEISSHYLANYLLPAVANENIYIPELSCLSQRLGNLLLKTIIKSKQIDLSKTTDCFLSLFNNIGHKKRKK